MITREHVEVIVPYVLVPRRFVVLTERRAIAPISCLHRQGDPLTCGVDLAEKVVRTPVNILVVFVEDDQDVPRVIGPPARGDERGDERGPKDDVRLFCPELVTLDAQRDPTERADVVRWLMTPHVRTLPLPATPSLID